MKKNSLTLKWYYSIHEESKDGWVWLTNNSYFKNSFIKITNKDNNKTIYTECRLIDDNFIYYYNHSDRRLKINDYEDIIILNFHYRYKLGICENKPVNLDFEIKNDPISKSLALKDHPNPIVRINFWLASYSIAISLLGILISIISVIC